MNNFKKLLASAMALTMVTSVLPASTEVNAAAPESTTCDGARTVYNNLAAFAEQNSVDVTSIKFNADYDEDDTVFEYITKNLGALSLVNSTWNPCNITGDNADKIRSDIEFLVDAAIAYQDVFVKVTSTSGQALGGYNGENYSHISGSIARLANYYSVSSLSRGEVEYDRATYELSVMETFLETYSSVLDSAELAQLENATDALADRLSEVTNDVYGDGLTDYVKQLEEGLENFVKNQTSDGAQNSITKAEITAQLNSIQKGSVKYNRYKDEADVIAIIDEYEAMYDEIDAVEDAINKRKNDVYVEFLDAVKAGKYANSNIDELYELIGSMKMSHYEAYKAFKEEVVDVVWQLTAKEYSTFYRDDSTKSNFVTETAKNVVLKDFNGNLGNEEKLTDLDRSTGLFGWDVLAAHMEQVITSYELITTELDKLVAKNLTASDREMIIALEDAWNFLDENLGNLTSSEKTVVKRAERSIDELYEAYREKFGSLAETTGWIPMGNGDWKYFEADGTAPTKWICTAPNTWYYVQNGVMMRNYWVWRDANSAYYVGDDGVMVYGPTTVNGYELDANGLWHR